MSQNVRRDDCPDNIYYNATMFNASTIPVVASYNETRTTPLLYDPSKYYLSVVRFNIPGSFLPIFIAQAVPFPNTDVNKLIYTVTLTRNGTTSGPINVEYNPNYSVTQPIYPVFSAQNPKQDPDDPYYYVYTYQSFIDIINTALAAAYTALPDKGTTTQAPYMTYDPSTGLFSMWAQQSYFQNADPMNPANLLIWFNGVLENFFPSFQYFYNGYTPTSNPPPFNGPGESYALVIKNNNNNTPAAPAGYYQMVQDYSSTFAWNDLQGISFRSNNIPVVFENQTGVSSVSVQMLQGSSSGNQIAFITDFEPLNGPTPGSFRENIQYFPPGEYRLTDLIGKTPLSTIDIQVYWTDTYGNVHPVFILPDTGITLKILFRKKALYPRHAA